MSINSKRFLVAGVAAATISALFTLFWTGAISGCNETKSIRAQTNIGVLDLRLVFGQEELLFAAMELSRRALPTLPSSRCRPSC